MYRFASIYDSVEEWRSKMIYDSIVIGGGQAGLAAAYHLKRAGLRFVILEAGAQAAGSWPSYYESLKLFSPAAYSSLPGLPFPGKGNRYPSRDEVIDYLTGYAKHFDFPVVTNTRVETVEALANEFRVRVNTGEVYSARSVIAATGSFSRPHIPEIQDQPIFRGAVLHSSAFKRSAPYQGQRVIVVGAGNSAVQIAYELAQVARVTLATRAPVKFFPQHILGQDVHFWTWLTGEDNRPYKNGQRSIHVLDTGVYRSAIEAGQPDRRPMFTAFTESGVEWADGQTESVDAVILATGYQPNLGFLAGLHALDSDGQAQHNGGVSTTTPGLYYVGLDNQRAFSSATLRGVGRDAAYVIRHLRQWVREPAAATAKQCCALPVGS
jgi:putative flavoprotein involved in K+ transport